MVRLTETGQGALAGHERMHDILVATFERHGGTANAHQLIKLEVTLDSIEATVDSIEAMRDELDWECSRSRLSLPDVSS